MSLTLAAGNLIELARMPRVAHALRCAAVALLLAAALAPEPAPAHPLPRMFNRLAATPPRGWNNDDAYGSRRDRGIGPTDR